MRISIVALLASLAGVYAERTGAYVQWHRGGTTRFLSPDGEPKEGTPVTLTDKASAVTWRWDDDHPEKMHLRVDGTDLCLSATDDTVEAGAQIVLTKCPSLPWEFSYFASEAFRIQVQRLLYCVEVDTANRAVVLNPCVGKYNNKAKYQDFIWQCPDDVEPDW